MPFKPIRVLIVGYALPPHVRLRDVLAKDPALEVSGPVRPEDISAVLPKPDIAVLDVQELSAQKAALNRVLGTLGGPVLVLTGPEGAAAAPTGAAVEFMPREQSEDGGTIYNFGTMLRIRLKSTDVCASHSDRGGNAAADRQTGAAGTALSSKASSRLIAIGASMGGVETTLALLNQLNPAALPGIVMVQHMKVGFTADYARQIERLTPFRAKEAQEGDIVEDGMALVARGGEQMTVVRRNGIFRIHSAAGPEVNGFCPSVDVLFRSVASAAGSRAAGVILTGIGRDGAEGLLEMHSRGARTWGQSPASCVVYGMPAAAKKIGAVDTEADLSTIAAGLQVYFRNYGSAD